VVKLMAPEAVPRYDEIIERATVEELSKRTDGVGQWAMEMIGSTDEEAVFINGARSFLTNYGQKSRRRAITYLAQTFGADRSELKRYLRFKGLVNLLD
jgi:hypothetical protein